VSFSVLLALVRIKLSAEILSRAKSILQQCRWRKEFLCASRTPSHKRNHTRLLMNNELRPREMDCVSHGEEMVWHKLPR
jgi:hypothetical protein